MKSQKITGSPQAPDPSLLLAQKVRPSAFLHALLDGRIAPCPASALESMLKSGAIHNAPSQTQEHLGLSKNAVTSTIAVNAKGVNPRNGCIIVEMAAFEPTPIYLAIPKENVGDSSLFTFDLGRDFHFYSGTNILVDKPAGIMPVRQPQNAQAKPSSLFLDSSGRQNAQDIYKGIPQDIFNAIKESGVDEPTRSLLYRVVLSQLKNPDSPTNFVKNPSLLQDYLSAYRVQAQMPNSERRKEGITLAQIPQPGHAGFVSYGNVFENNGQMTCQGKSPMDFVFFKPSIESTSPAKTQFKKELGRLIDILELAKPMVAYATKNSNSMPGNSAIRALSDMICDEGLSIPINVPRTVALLQFVAEELKVMRQQGGKGLDSLIAVMDAADPVLDEMEKGKKADPHDLVSFYNAANKKVSTTVSGIDLLSLTDYLIDELKRIAS